MNDFIKKLAEIEKSISEEKGNFRLFAVFSKTDHFGKWDVVISADWIKDEREGLELISANLTKNLSPEEIVKISRIVHLDANEKFVRTMNTTFEVENHNLVVIDNCDINGILIVKGYVLASQDASRTLLKKHRVSRSESVIHV